MVLMLGVVTPVFAYNQGAAKWYADTYVHVGYLPRPASEGGNYRRFGQDCTNFVSACLRAGGLSPTYWWYYHSYYLYSNTWTLADGLKNYMRDNLGATKLGNWAYKAGYRGSTYYYSYLVDNSANIQGLGSEVVFYDWNSNGKMDHAAIVVGTSNPYKDRFGINTTLDTTRWGDLIDAHSTDRRHQIWNLYRYNGD